ncbi:MAG: CinA family nicotinamide mononucleotide deamidase-related protein [Pseudoflavonifractor sp.]|nr:CinA family nicotinamide mononucleotide deamidase-related protein [Pseudoflavonifractor sp.]
MNVSIIAIGDELLIGQVIDTNSGDIARYITPFGWRINDVQVVGDNAAEIKRAIDRAFESSDVVLTTGGLGPTKDDITKGCLCNYFGGELYENIDVLDNVKEVVAKRGLRLNDLTAAQAMVPSSCRVIQNRVGTAPIMWFERDGRVLVAMPGVPFETRTMFREEVMPQLLDRFTSDTAIGHRTIIVTDWSESQLATHLATWEEALPPYLHLAYLPKPGLIRLRIDGTHPDKTFIEAELDKYHDQLVSLVGDTLICDGDKTMARVLLDHLERLSMTVATAESCTGGNIAHLITSEAGASASFMGGVVAYSNDVKSRILGVEEDTLQSCGAVSIPVVGQMSAGVTKALSTDCGIATSGIAGPGGGTPDKPVGTVCISVTTPGGTVSETFHFPGSRDRVIDRASTVALIMAIKQLRRL